MIIKKGDLDFEITASHLTPDGFIQGFVASSEMPSFLKENSAESTGKKQFDQASLIELKEMTFILREISFKSWGFFGFLRIKIDPLEAMIANGWTARPDYLDTNQNNETKE